jgi:hypothetical protein
MAENGLWNANGEEVAFAFLVAAVSLLILLVITCNMQMTIDGKMSRHAQFHSNRNTLMVCLIDDNNGADNAHMS